MSITSRIHALGFGLVLAAGIALAPASASAGFFEQLFGGGAPEQPAQPSYQYNPPSAPDGSILPSSPGSRAKPRVSSHPKPARHKLALNSSGTSPRQTPTDLMHDKTLRPGDAIMMKDGMHVYSGPEAAKHSNKQFVKVAAARSVSAPTRAALLALNTSGHEPAGHAPDKLASGRSAAVGAPISAGFKITDARGASVRYVGP